MIINALSNKEFTFFLLGIISYFGLIIGTIISKYTEEELKSGIIYFKKLKSLLLAFIIPIIFYHILKESKIELGYYTELIISIIFILITIIIFLIIESFYNDLNIKSIIQDNIKKLKNKFKNNKNKNEKTNEKIKKEEKKEEIENLFEYINKIKILDIIFYCLSAIILYETINFYYTISIALIIFYYGLFTSAINYYALRELKFLEKLLSNIKSNIIFVFVLLLLILIF